MHGNRIAADACRNLERSWARITREKRAMGTKNRLDQE
jgi:hypothetical protein